MLNKFERGFVPPIVILLLAIIGISGILIIKNLPANQSDSLSNSTFTAKYNQNTSTPTSTPTSTKTPTPTTISTSTTTPSSTSNPTPTNTPTLTATTTPTANPTPTPKTYTWTGNNLKAKTICDINDQSRFNVQISGSVTPQNNANGVWTTITGNNQTIITSYEAGGGYPVRVSINSFNGSIISSRTGSMILRMTDNYGTYMYTLKAYEAPYTYGIPILANPIGSVEFGTDCR